MTELSPAAQAVFWEFNSAFDWVQDAVPGPQYKAIAAALRAAADQAHPKAQIEDIDYVHQSYVDGWKDALAVLQEIADELEAQ
jgi:hypothetical protein